MSGLDPVQYIQYSKPVTPAAGTTVHTTSTEGAYTNQPSNDGVEIGSDNAGDTMDITIWGTTTGTDTVVSETVTLTGTTFVATTKTDWGVILGAELSALGLGTITLREASADGTITTIDSTSTTKSGIEEVAATSQIISVTPSVVAAQASTKQLGMIGEDPDGTAILDSQAMTGTTKINMNKAFYKLTRILVGDMAAGDDVVISSEAAANCDGSIGLHNYGAAGTFRVSYKTLGPQKEHLEDTLYLTQGQSRGGRFWRVWLTGTDSGLTASALY